MTKLRAPLRELLDDSLDDTRVQRMWRELSHAPPRRGRGPWLVAGALVLSAVAILSVMQLRDAGPLAAESGGALHARLPSGVLSDGSRIALGAGAELQLVNNSAREFGLRLHKGQVQLAVTPGGPRRWSIDCGLVEVIVVGTQLTIDRSAQGVRVEVAHGVVEVRGARVASGVQRLRAGQVLEVSAQPQLTAAEVNEPMLDVAARGNAEVGDAQSTLAEADRARREGAVGRALSLLETVVRQWPGTPEAAIAGFTLARMQMREHPREAAQALRATIAAGVPDSLREDVLARLVEAHALAGERKLAAKSAAEYRRQYPHGRRAAEVEHWARGQ